MDGIKHIAELRAEGYSHDEVLRLTRAGELIRLRRGAYATRVETEASERHRHRQLIRATVPLCVDASVVSHESAAVLWNLPLLGSPPARVQLTRPDVNSGKRRGLVHLHAARLDPSERTTRNGYPVTTLSRTVIDLTRTLTFSGGVVLGDAALAAGLGSAELERSLLRARGIHGVGRDRRVCAFLDGLSESPGESLSRVVFAQAGLPAPTLQRAVFGPDGDLVGRADFCWEEQQTLGAFDGKIKYGRLLAPGQTAGDSSGPKSCGRTPCASWAGRSCAGPGTICATRPRCDSVSGAPSSARIADLSCVRGLLCALYPIPAPSIAVARMG